MKMNATFKISKPTKRVLATLTGEARTIYKKEMIQAEYTASVNDRVILTGKEPKEK
jgi:hypothetical protein